MRAEIKRLEQKRYIVKFITYVIVVLTILTLLYLNASYKPQIGQVIEHTVKQGENLTSIANKYSDDYVLKTIASIKKLNGMTESDLVVGQVLKVEVK